MARITTAVVPAVRAGWIRRGRSIAGLLLLAAFSSAAGCAGQSAEALEALVMPAQQVWSAPPAQAPASEGYVDVGGARLWYWDTGGDGEPVVLVHPYSGSALIWKYQQPVLSRAGYRVIAYSRRGHYQSDSGRAESPGTGADDLHRAIEHLGLAKVHLVGLAAGADILPDFAISHPERLLSLAIGSTIGKPGDPAYRQSDDFLLPPEFLDLPAWLKELSPAYRAANPEGTQRWKELEEISKARRVPVPARNAVTPARIRQIDAPTLLFTGDSDLYMPPSRLRAYAGYWRDPELTVFSEAGHAPHWEQPDAFNRRLLDFLRHAGATTEKEPAASGNGTSAAAPGGLRTFGRFDGAVRQIPPQTRWLPVPDQAPVTEGFVDVGGARLWYWDTGGDGEPVVLLHPYTGSAAIWGYQQPALAAAGYRVIAYSRRGHYRSETGPLDDTGSSVEDLHALANHLELDRFHLAGSGAGGFIVPDYAVSHPERLLSMTIACSTGGSVDESYRGVFLTIRTPEIVELPHWVKELGPSYRAANPRGVEAWMELEEKSVHALIRPPASNRLTREAYENLDLPVLLVGADADMYMPPPMLRELASHFTDPEVVIISESGHSAYWEQPDAFNRTLLGFLQRHGTANR